MNSIKTGMTLLALLLGVATVGCETHTGNAALLGGAGGALAGAAIGSHSHGRAGAGALVGGTIGALGGALVGNEMDRQERDRYSEYDRGGYSRDRYYDDADYYRVERRTYRPRYRRTVRYDDCPPARYEHRTYRSYGRGGRYYETTYYEY
jgi:uncharacterized protein YcfJ